MRALGWVAGLALIAGCSASPAGDRRGSGGAGGEGLDAGADALAESGSDSGLDGGAPGCPTPEPVYGPPGDNTSDARTGGAGRLFWRVSVPPFTDPVDLAAEGRASDGVGIVDLDQDGKPDLVAVRNRPGQGAVIHWFRNLGCLEFERRALTLDPPASGRLDVPTFADLDGDGLLDFYVGSSGPTGTSRLYLARGGYDRFVDVAGPMGAQNRGAYNHGHAGIADLDGDGRLDLAVGANQIGNPGTGRALKRLYVYRPPAGGGAWEAGHFVDVSTETELVPDFMRRGASVVTAESCDEQLDRSGALVLARDLDDDGDLDLLNGSSNDMFTGTLSRPCPTGEWRFGVFAWRSLLAQGEARYELVAEAPGALADHGQMTYVGTPPSGSYEVASLGRAFAPLSMNAADVDNDGDLDVIGLSPTDQSWHVQSDLIAGRFWRNDGGWRFSEGTDAAGLEPLNWTYGRLTEFWDTAMPASLPLADWACSVSDWNSACRDLGPNDYQMMLGGGSIFADFDNDGWLDLHVVDRHDAPLDVIRNLLFLNDGDGTFTLLQTEDSGIDGTGISADARDLDGDGRLEIVVLERSDELQSDPSYPARDRVYWNSGARGAAANHWVEITLSGRPAAELVGAKLLLRPRGDRVEILGRRDLFPSAGTYKTSQDSLAHFGLGPVADADLEIVLYQPGAAPSPVLIEGIPTDRRIRVDVESREVTVLP